MSAGSSRLAGLSVDVDSVSSHLAGYGLRGDGSAAEAYRVAVPRALELFDEVGARATFFLIAAEARRYPEIVRHIQREGHEVASHSLTHSLPFPRTASSALEGEVVESKSVLESLSGHRVAGFRAPSWQYSDALADSLAEAGYQYDASTYPSPLLFLLRRSIAARGAEERARRQLGATWRECLAPATVHRLERVNRRISEVPVCTTPLLRIPYYHTLCLMLPRPVQRLIGAWARSRSRGVSYCFHAVDFLAMATDSIDPRMGRHPGMSLPLDRKLVLAREALQELSQAHRIVPLAELVTAESPIRVGGESAARPSRSESPPRPSAGTRGS